MRKMISFLLRTCIEIQTTRNTVYKCSIKKITWVLPLYCLLSAFKYLQCTPRSSSSILYGKPNPLSPFHYRVYDVENDWFATFTDLPGTGCLLNLQNQDVPTNFCHFQAKWKLQYWQICIHFAIIWLQEIKLIIQIVVLIDKGQKILKANHLVLQKTNEIFA